MEGMNQELRAEVRTYLGRGDIADPVLQKKVGDLVTLYEEVATDLMNRFDPEGKRTEAPSDWADNEVDQALRDFMFWWRWGN